MNLDPDANDNAAIVMLKIFVILTMITITSIAVIAVIGGVFSVIARVIQ